MPRRVEDTEPDRPEPNDPALGQFHGRHRWRDLERREERSRIGQPIPVERMDGYLGTGMRGDRRVVTDVIPVAVGRDDELERPAPVSEFVGDPGQARRCRIDRDRLVRARVGQDVNVRGDRSDDPGEAL
jgi:hypothetical protein